MLELDVPIEAAEVRALTLLGLAVIRQAIWDATILLPAQPEGELQKDVSGHWLRARQYRDEGRHFLTVDNLWLRFWCRVAGLQVRTVLHYAKGADWPAIARKFHRERSRSEPTQAC